MSTFASLNSHYLQGAIISILNAASTIPRISDKAAYEANSAAIDRIVATEKYHHLVAWGKWLGFTPETIRSMVETAGRDDAPPDAIQKIGRRWLRLEDIQNESNRNRVNDLAQRSKRAPEQWMAPWNRFNRLED